MVSKNEIRIITSLAQKKYRKKYQLFVAEGVKVVKDLLHSHFEIHQIYATCDFENTLENLTLTNVTHKDLQKLSQLKTSQKVIGIFKIPKPKKELHEGLQIALDSIQDPGNLGTIIRLCDWFGVTDLICSEDTVDCYNPKVVQATMGSLSRVNISYKNLDKYFQEYKHPIYASTMEGDNVYNQKFPKDCLLIMGNEANGIRKNNQDLADFKLSIPKHNSNSKVESLNVAMATAIFLTEFRR